MSHVSVAPEACSGAISQPAAPMFGCELLHAESRRALRRAAAEVRGDDEWHGAQVSRTGLPRFRARLPDWFIGIPLARRLREAIEVLALRPGERVVDLSCGSRFALRWLREAVGREGQVLAVEDNPHLRARAAGKARARGWTNVRFFATARRATH